MSLESLYREENKNNSYSNVFCNSVNTNNLTFNGTDILTSLGPPNYLHAFKTTNQSVASGAALNPIVNYTSASGSLSANFNSTTGEFTVPEDGYYYVASNVSFQSNSGNSRRLFLVEPSGIPSPGIESIPANGLDTDLCFCHLRFFSATTVINISVNQNSGVALNVFDVGFTIIKSKFNY